MSNFVVSGESLNSVANAIRQKGGTMIQLEYPSGFISAINNLSGVSERMTSALQSMAERKCSYFEDFAFDNERYAVIDLSSLDDTDYSISNIGERAFSGFTAPSENGTARKIRIKMPKNLESISGANWHGAARVQYYDFSGYQGTDDDCAEGNAQGESMSTLLQKFQSELSVIDSHNFQTNPRFSWIDEIENDELYMKVLALPEKDMELLTMIAFEGFTQREVAEIRKVAPAAICKKIKKLKKILFEG